MNWKDISSYSRSEPRGPEPKSVRASLDWLNVTVTRHRDYPGKWILLADCLGIYQRPLRAVTCEEAKDEALGIVRETLRPVADAMLRTPAGQSSAT